MVAMVRLRSSLPAALAVVAVLAMPARAYVPEDTPPRRAEAAARAMLAEEPARGTIPGVVVMRGGRMLWSLNADTALVPASIMKLATTTTGMVRFGPEHRFPTRVLATRVGDTVQTLTIVGGGDPTFATEAYRRKRFLPKPSDEIKIPAFASGSPTVEQLAARVRDAGVRRVTGDLIADESLFDTERTQPGWLASYLDDDPDVSLLSALTINEGRAGADRDRVVPNPARAAAGALRAALADLGITVAGTVRVGRAPEGSKEIARVESPPLTEIVDFINRYSVNYPAELLLKSLGTAFRDRGTTAAGVEVVRETLADLGVGIDGFEMTDGSGLSVLNRMTPRTIAGILHAILTRRGPGWEELRASLPAAGGPGTLLHRMADPPTAGNLRGKTGQIRRVRGMVGWVTASDGVPLIYVAIFNEAPSPFALTSPLDLFGLLLARFPR